MKKVILLPQGGDAAIASAILYQRYNADCIKTVKPEDLENFNPENAILIMIGFPADSKVINFVNQHGYLVQEFISHHWQDEHKRKVTKENRQNFVIDEGQGHRSTTSLLNAAIQPKIEKCFIEAANWLNENKNQKVEEEDIIPHIALTYIKLICYAEEKKLFCPNAIQTAQKKFALWIMGKTADILDEWREARRETDHIIQNLQDVGYGVQVYPEKIDCPLFIEEIPTEKFTMLELTNGKTLIVAGSEKIKEEHATKYRGNLFISKLPAEATLNILLDAACVE